ncbi:MAG: 3-phosphoshikimate 1-carboxyvinyltransferase [Clostridiales bacterium]|nr:3-phosphoshikimate 1-carboxyvinyltransferase [Clostridiales bacterium]
MDVKIKRGDIIDGSEVFVPSSKSHSIRAVFIAGLAKGRSYIENLLLSDDVMSAIDTMRKFGAIIDINNDCVIIDGVGGKVVAPNEVIDVGNSGTTLRFAMLVAASANGTTTLTGDSQIQKRPIGELARLIKALGGSIEFLKNEDFAPVRVTGKIYGGVSLLDAFSSQYLSSALITCPLLSKDTNINLVRLNERPYVDMTLWWLDKQNIKYINNLPDRITIFGGQSFSEFSDKISGDYSSATFFIVLAAISGRRIVLKNLKLDDKQGDKKVLSVIESFGAHVIWQDDAVIVCGKKLVGRVVDMNDIPDALPAMAVLGCFASGETRLINVLQARYKETDRIHVMCEELSKVGANIQELQDGLIIKKSDMHGGEVSGHKDHRVVMALAILGACVKESVILKDAESVNITFPGFFEVLQQMGAKVFLGNT